MACSLGIEQGNADVDYRARRCKHERLVRSLNGSGKPRCLRTCFDVLWLVTCRWHRLVQRHSSRPRLLASHKGKMDLSGHITGPSPRAGRAFSMMVASSEVGHCCGLHQGCRAGGEEVRWLVMRMSNVLSLHHSRVGERRHAAGLDGLTLG
jgi:hypothetical protein